MQQRTLLSIKPKNSLDADVKEVGGNTTPKKVINQNSSQSRGDSLIYAKIQQRRLQMLVHSCIYYELNTSLITDKQFDTWARELAKLQKDYPDISKQVPWYEEFIDWDGTTGFNLPLRNPWVVSKSMKLLRLRRENYE